MELSEEQYQIILANILKAAYVIACHGQTAPDHHNCRICGDDDHSAPKCHINAFNIWKADKL